VNSQALSGIHNVSALVSVTCDLRRSSDRFQCGRVESFSTRDRQERENLFLFAVERERAIVIAFCEQSTGAQREPFVIETEVCPNSAKPRGVVPLLFQSLEFLHLTNRNLFGDKPDTGVRTKQEQQLGHKCPPFDPVI